RAKVPIAPVADDKDNQPAVEFRRHFQSSAERTSAAHSGENSFFPGKSFGEEPRVRFDDIDNAVDPFAFVNFRQELRRPSSDPWNARTVCGLCADDLDVLSLLLQIARATHDGARRAHGGDEVGNLAIRVAPDLGTSRSIVDSVVVWVGKLIQDIVSVVGSHLFGKLPRKFYSLRRRRQDNLCAVSFHGENALAR